MTLITGVPMRHLSPESSPSQNLKGAYGPQRESLSQETAVGDREKKNMTIRVKLRGDKAIVRLTDKQEESWFRMKMRDIRDSMTELHPKISVMDGNGEIPRAPQQKKPPYVPSKIPPEIMGTPVVIDGKKVIQDDKKD